jgi:drug/metabolite transporter (DMT)-like permease
MSGSLQRLASYSVDAALPACCPTKAQESASAQDTRGQTLKAYRGVCAMNLSLYLLTVLIWGTTWIALKWQLGVVAIPVSIVYRFGLAALVLFALLLLSRRLQPMNRRGHLICVAQGLCLFCVNFMCFLTASQWIPSGLVAVVFSTATLWNALNARVFFGQRIARNVLMGGALGLFGLGMLFWPELAGHQASPQTLLGLGLALCGTLCFSAGNMLSSLQQKAGLKPLTTNAWGMAYGAAMLSVWCLVKGIPFDMDWSAALCRCVAVFGDSRFGHWLHRLPDAGRAHGAGACGLLHGVVPSGGAERFGVCRRLSMDSAGSGRAGVSDAGQRAGVS